MKHETANLSGKLLDLAVAISQGYGIEVDDEFVWLTVCGTSVVRADHRPYSSDWEYAGPLIEEELITVRPTRTLLWRAEREWSEAPDICTGNTLLEAAMRCYVRANLGDEVELPDGIENTVERGD